MNVSNSPTNIIAVQARTGSEWDSVDFAIIRISEQLIRDLKERLECLSLVKDSKNLACLMYWESPAGWFIYSTDEKTDAIYDALINNEWVYLDITEEEIADLDTTDQIIDGEILKIQSEKSMQFRGYGKHTNEEFWTSDIPMEKIIKDFEAI